VKGYGEGIIDMGLNYDYDETYLKPGRTEHFTEGRSFNEDIRWNNLMNVILKIKGVSHNGNEFDHTPYG
jgi:hypothetical protein